MSTRARDQQKKQRQKEFKERKEHKEALKIAANKSKKNIAGSENETDKIPHNEG